MKEQSDEKLSRIHDQLIAIERELAGYSALMGSIYREVSINGKDLIGPSQALGKNSRKIQKILKAIDHILINNRK